MLRVVAILMSSMLWLEVRAAIADEPSADDLQFFEQNIRSLLEQRCFKCHSAQAKTVESGLQLDSRPGWEQGGESGAVIIPGKPEESLHATILRLLGMDHTKLTYLFNGRNFRLTDVAGDVVQGIVA